MELFIAIAITHFIALLSPGPDFFLILTTLLSHHKTVAQQVCWGIALGNAIILLLVFSSLYWVGKMDTLTLKYLKWMGACYLLYLSFLCFRYARSKIDMIYSESGVKHIVGLKQAMLGLQSSLLNPKNILFYGSLTLLVAKQFDVYQKIAISGWMVSVVLVWNLFLVGILTRKRWMDFLTQQSRWLYRISGVCFFMFALFLVVIPQ